MRSLSKPLGYERSNDRLASALFILIVLKSLSAVHAFSSQAPKMIIIKSKGYISDYSSVGTAFRDNVPSLPCHRVHRRQFTILYSSMSSAEEQLPKLDQFLSKLTSMFPLFVLGSAILGSYVPNALNWVNSGNYISLMLAG